MSVIASINLETGDLSQFTSTSGDDISASADAKLIGTNYGLKIVLDDATADYGVIGSLSNTSGKLRIRFYFHLNSMTMANADAFDLLMFYNSSAARLGQIKVSKSGSNYRIDASLWDV